LLVSVGPSGPCRGLNGFHDRQAKAQNLSIHRHKYGEHPLANPKTGSIRPASQAALIERGLRWCELFSTWPAHCLQRLIPAVRLRRYRRGAQVLGHDSARRELLVVVSGSLEVAAVNESGRRYVNSLLGPRHVVPLVRLLDDVPLSYGYDAHEDSVVLHIPADAVIEVLDADPGLWREVARLALYRQRLSVGSLRAQMVGSIQRRLAATLLNMEMGYHLSGQPAREGLLQVSQADLAAMLGLSRQTINKELAHLRDLGLVDYGGGYKRLRIVDLAALQRLVET